MDPDTIFPEAKARRLAAYFDEHNRRVPPPGPGEVQLEGLVCIHVEGPLGRTWSIPVAMNIDRRRLPMEDYQFQAVALAEGIRAVGPEPPARRVVEGRVREVDHDAWYISGTPVAVAADGDVEASRKGSACSWTAAQDALVDLFGGLEGKLVRVTVEELPE